MIHLRDGCELVGYNKEVMKLPNGDSAFVEESKLREYVLNPRHPVGRHHAALFERLLGIHLGNTEVLKSALLSAAVNEEVTRDVVTLYGRKYEIRFALSGPLGTKRVVSIWIIDEGSDHTRLVTSYVE